MRVKCEVRCDGIIDNRNVQLEPGKSYDLDDDRRNDDILGRGFVAKARTEAPADKARKTRSTK